jgi:hypothetical protein
MASVLQFNPDAGNRLFGFGTSPAPIAGRAPPGAANPPGAEYVAAPYVYALHFTFDILLAHS